MAIGLALTFGATGCKHKPPPTTPIPGYGQTKVADPGIGGVAKPEDGTGASPGSTPLNPDIKPDDMNQDREKFKSETVHFDYDSAAIRSGERPKIETVASFMKSAPANTALLVEGHCDERGTEEYNRALGERRALAVREALISAGADGMKIVTRSFGKDRKIDLGTSEASHAKNRRGEFVVLTPK
jgi:peptidoglycan-associated lipoprotein